MRRNLLVVLSVTWGTLLGCSGDADPVAIAPARAYWALQFNVHAVNLALAAPAGHPVPDTIRLVATPRTATGALLTGVSDMGPVQFHAADSAVSVDSTGLVTARYITSQTYVTASLTAQGVTLVDTAVFEVTDSAPPASLVTFSLHPVEGDSAKYAIDGENYYDVPMLRVDATNSHGDSLCTGDAPCAVAFTSSNPSVATINRFGNINPIAVGRVTFTATSLVYGVPVRDSLPYVIGYPLGGSVRLFSRTPGSAATTLYFAPATFTVGVGATVYFGFATTALDTVDIIFQDTSGVLGGNVPAISNVLDDTVTPGYAVRTFTRTGTYSFQSRKLGTGGTIYVSAGP